jgi:hypothetical protein
LWFYSNAKAGPVNAAKIEAIQTYDQILAHVGYQVESYGKYHLPPRWTLTLDGTGNAITFDSYATGFAYPYHQNTSASAYGNQIAAWTANLTKKFLPGQQVNPRSGWPYTPLPLDVYYNKPLRAGVSEEGVIGVDSLPAEYSTTAYTGRAGQTALRRLAAQTDKPWALTVSFESPRKSSARRS